MKGKWRSERRGTGVCITLRHMLCINSHLVGNTPVEGEVNGPVEGGNVLGLAGHSNRHHCRRIGFAGDRRSETF